MDLNQTIDCPQFKSLQQLKDNFGKADPTVTGLTCTGCPKMVLMGGLMTCKYLHELSEKGELI